MEGGVRREEAKRREDSRDAPAVIALSVEVNGELSATPNEAITPSPSWRSFTDATDSGAPFTRQLAPTRTAAAADWGMASESRVKSSSLTTPTMRVGHEMGGRPVRVFFKHQVVRSSGGRRSWQTKQTTSRE